MILVCQSMWAWLSLFLSLFLTIKAKGALTSRFSSLTTTKQILGLIWSCYLSPDPRTQKVQCFTKKGLDRALYLSTSFCGDWLKTSWGYFQKWQVLKEVLSLTAWWILISCHGNTFGSKSFPHEWSATNSSPWILGQTLFVAGVLF